MAKVKIRTTIEGSIDKYDAFQALCEELGLQMLIDDNLRDYGIEDGTLYKYIEISRYGIPDVKKEVISEDYRLVTLFESLLTIKSLI